MSDAILDAGLRSKINERAKAVNELAMAAAIGQDRCAKAREELAEAEKQLEQTAAALETAQAALLGLAQEAMLSTAVEMTDAEAKLEFEKPAETAPAEQLAKVEETRGGRRRR